ESPASNPLCRSFYSCPHLHYGPGKLQGRQIVQRTMRSLLVVIQPPVFDLSSCISQTRKPVRVQAFISQSAIEALRVSVLHRLARLDELQSHPSFFAPGREGSTAKLGPIVQNDRFRQSSLAGNPIQYTAHSQPAQRSVHLNRAFP